MKKNKNTFVADEFKKISEIIDKDGNKLNNIKGDIIENKKVFNINEVPAVNNVNEGNSISSKIEKRINDKINDIIDKKIEEILSKII